MRKRFFVGSFVVCVILGLAPIARACSCSPPNPRDSLGRSDAAFIGRLIERGAPSEEDERREGSMALADWRFRVDEAVKGDLGSEVIVRSSNWTASCGLAVDEGESVGLFLRRSNGAWEAGLCSEVSPDQMRKAAEGLPEPTSDGPVSVVVGGNLGEVRTVALDAQGRTVAYGDGGGWLKDLDACPGSRLIAEVVYGVEDRWWATSVAVRDADTLRIVREFRVAAFEERDPEVAMTPFSVACLDPDAKAFAVYGTNEDLASKLVRIEGDRETVLFEGPALRSIAFTLDGSSAYIAEGREGTTLTRIMVPSGDRTELGNIPRHTMRLAIDDEGSAVAGIAGHGSDLFLVDLDSRQVTNSDDDGEEIAWIGGGHLAVSKTASDLVRIYDRSLSMVDSWKGSEVGWKVHVDGALFGIAGESVFSAPARTGPRSWSMVGIRQT